MRTITNHVPILAGKLIKIIIFISYMWVPYHAGAFDVSGFQQNLDQDAVSFTKTLEKSLEAQVHLAQEIGIGDLDVTSGQIDAASDICRKSQQIMSNKFSSNSEEADFYIFISSSLPNQVLKQMVAEAKKYHGILVMRGLIDNSVSKTVKYLQQFVQNENEGIIIDPTLFQKYQIKLVPSFVLSSSDAVQYDIIKGFITQHYALSQFSKQGSLKAEALARLGP